VSWFPVDDAFHTHPKSRKAGLEAVGLWTVSGSFCMAYLTDGFVPEWFVKEKPRGAALAKRLVEAGLWKAGKKAGESGWWFHQWKPECTKHHVEAAREKARQRKAKQRESQRESRVTDDVSPASCLVPTQPNPTQPINTLVNSGGELTQVGDYEPPPQFCPRHPNGTDEPCWACGQRRKERETWTADLPARRAELKRKLAVEMAEKVAACPLCDEYGMRELSNGLARCNHEEAS
jgi:hypothetical protein